MTNDVMQMQNAQSAVVEFQDMRGEAITLTPEIVRRFITGDANVTESEFRFFAELCRARRLNPFLKEAYCIKYGSQAAQIVVSKDVYLQRADSFPDYDGKQSGVIIENQHGIEEREGCFYSRATENLLGAWCKVYRKSRTYPEYMSVALAEVASCKANGEMNGTWAKMPATMCEKVAVVRALRAAFPQEFSQMYIEDEMNSGDPAPAQAPVAEKTNSEQYVCCDCGKPFTDWHRPNGEYWTVKDVYDLAKSRNADGKARCTACSRALQEAQDAHDEDAQEAPAND